MNPINHSSTVAQLHRMAMKKISFSTFRLGQDCDRMAFLWYRLSKLTFILLIIEVGLNLILQY